MPVYRFPRVKPSEITPEAVWQTRRQWIKAAGAAALTGVAAPWSRIAHGAALADLGAKRNPSYVVMDTPTPEKDVTSYNNFYEFGTDKGDPFLYAKALKTEPWTIEVVGEVAAPRTFGIDELRKLAPLEERIYRMRCVEAWSMVIPWVGYPLSALLAQVQPTSKAKFVEFQTAMQPEAMPGLHSRVIDWPYTEGLRIDEAMHPLTLLTVGLYGKALPNQNGAPVRVVIPWKYGLKSAKSIVRIRLVEKQPVTSWERIAPSEYGFYGNVNPEVDHPRWSQGSERRIGDGGIFAPRHKTLMFNGYANEVASLYQGMDLHKFY